MTRIQKARALPILPNAPTHTVDYNGEAIKAHRSVTQNDFDRRIRRGIFGADPVKCAQTPYSPKRNGGAHFNPWVGPENERR